jgi:hypothetical protein
MGHATVDIVFAASTSVDDDASQGNAVPSENECPFECCEYAARDPGEQRLAGRVVPEKVVQAVVHGAPGAGTEQGAVGCDGLGVLMPRVVDPDVVRPLPCVGIVLSRLWEVFYEMADFVWFLDDKPDIFRGVVSGFFLA